MLRIFTYSHCARRIPVPARPHVTTCRARVTARGATPPRPPARARAVSLVYRCMAQKLGQSCHSHHNSRFKVTCLFSPKASQELRAVSWRVAPKLDASYTACSLLERWPGEHVGRRPEHRHDTEGSETRDLSRARLGRPPAAPAHVFARGLEEEKREHEEIERRDVDDAVGVEELAWLG